MGSEVIVYVPAAGHRASAGIARGSALVGRPDARREEVRIYYEGALYGQSEMRTLADRAVYACGRMVDDYPTAAAMSVPRDALVAVGTFDRSTSEILLTGDQSAAAVAEWLGMPQLDPAELQPGLEHPLTVRKLADPEIKVVVNGSLALELTAATAMRLLGPLRPSLDERIFRNPGQIPQPAEGGTRPIGGVVRMDTGQRCAMIHRSARHTEVGGSRECA